MSGRSGWTPESEAVMLRAMAANDPLAAFLASFKRKRAVADVIASETWTFKDAERKMQTARVEIGTPRRVPNDEHADWFCPVFIEGWSSHVLPVMGVGPIDSLMNAITLVRGFREQIGSFQRATDGRKVRRRKR